MKTEPNDTAYPTRSGEAEPTYGLTKREHFAAMAMMGYCSANNPGPQRELIEASIMAADALIAELNKSK